MVKTLLLLILICLLNTLYVVADISGSCGTGVTYSYTTRSRTLTIRGSGEMSNYRVASDVPWYSYRGRFRTLIIEDGVTSIGDYAFMDCSGLTSVTIPNSVTNIGNNAFAGSTGLTSVTIGNGVTSIGSEAFSGCSGLTSVLSLILTPFSPGENAFKGISKECVLTVPAGMRDAYIAKGWTTSVFGGGVLDVVIFGSCGENVTYSYSSLDCTLTIRGRGEMSNSDVPWSSYDIKSIIIEDGVTSIGKFAFRDCTGLASVTIPNSVTSIGKFAFSGCI